MDQSIVSTVKQENRDEIQYLLVSKEYTLTSFSKRMRKMWVLSSQLNFKSIIFKRDSLVFLKAIRDQAQKMQQRIKNKILEIITSAKLIYNQEWQRVGFGPGFFIFGPDPRVKISGLDLAHLLCGFFSRGSDLPPPEPTGPVKGLSPISGPTKKKKRIEAQIYFCHIQPAYSNSSLDNVAQMPKPNQKRKKEKKN